MASKRWTHIRVPVELAARLEGMARTLEKAYSEGRRDLPGAMIDHVPQWYAIQAALDEQAARRERSRRPRRKREPSPCS